MLPEYAWTSFAQFLTIATCWQSFSSALVQRSLSNATSAVTSVTRDTSYGKVRGVREEVLPGRTVERFLGIPFAKPPTGPLRFEPPQPPDGWGDTIYDALDFSFYCVQSHGDRSYIMEVSPSHGAALSSSEDCLYLNIYTPIVEIQELLSVMVYIHGGSNAVGTGAMRDGSVLASYGKIVVVTINYRVAELGFLGLGKPGFPGNYGLLDQIAALKWVKRNIKHFNGDPNRVTAVGHSAGAIDVGLHLISPLAKGLFRYAVLMSGSPVMPYASTKIEDNMLVLIRKNLKALGCNYKVAARVKKCLKQIKTKAFHNTHKFPCELYSGIADGHFLPDTANVLMHTAPINAESVMVGITKDEINAFTHSVSFEDVVKKLVFCGIPKYKALHHVIQHEYNTEDGDKGRIFSDYLMNSPVRKFAETLVKRHVTTFTYQYDYVSLLSGRTEGMFMHRAMAVPHGHDVRYVFGEPIKDPHARKFTDNDRRMSEIMMHIWSSFVKFGRPTLNVSINNATVLSNAEAALPFDLRTGPFLTLGGLNSSTVRVSRPFLNSKTEFWNKVVPNLIDYLKSGILSSEPVGDLERDYFISWVVAGIFITSTILLLTVLVILTVCKYRTKREDSV